MGKIEIYVVLIIDCTLNPRPPIPRPSLKKMQQNQNNMETKYILSDIDFYHFTYYIATTFMEYLVRLHIKPYEKLDENWWHSLATEFVPIIDSEDECDENMQIALYNRVIAELNFILTNEQKDEISLERDSILKQVKVSIVGFINRKISVCYCGDEECDWTCGVQICGCCIDKMSCGYYDYYKD